MSLTLNFLGGAPFQLLYDGVKAAISATRRFRTQLINLEFTLDCLQPQIIEQIRNNNVQLSLPDDIIQDLQVKMNEGIDLVARLSQLSMWNICIWGNCCNCIKPNYAEQLEDLDRSLRRLLELLKLEQIRNITLLMLRIDEIERRQSDILQALQDIPGHISRAQQEVIQRMQANVAQKGRNGEGGAAAAAPVLGVVYGMLYDAVIQVKVKNLMFNRLLGEFKHSLDCLKPLIEEVANNNKVLHLPMLELEDFVIEMEKAVEFVHKCSKVSRLANYRKYPWTNKLLKLDKYLQKLFIDFTGQMEGKVKEAMELVSNIETVMNQTKDSGVVESDDIASEGRSPLPQPHSPSVGLELQTVLETSTHVIKKTLINTATITEEVVKPSEESNIEPAPSHVVELDVLNVQEARDEVKETLNSTRNLEVGDIGTEGTKGNVQETSEVKEMLDRAKDMDETEMIRIEESDVWKLRNQTEIAVADQHGSPEPTVQLKVPDVYEETGDMQKTTTAAGEHKKIKGKNAAVKNESETAAATLPSSSLVALFPRLRETVDMQKTTIVTGKHQKIKDERDTSATKIQKVYKSYRTRRNLADCAVVVEELWWNALADSEQNRVSFCDDEEQRTAVSRRTRAKKRAAKFGKGLCKDEKAHKLALKHWLEAIDPRHRYGHNLLVYYDVWTASKSSQPFFYWLDVGDGKDTTVMKCPRSDLQHQCIKYLGPMEREAYEVIIEDGKLVQKQSGLLVDTDEGSKWIFVLSTSRSLYVGQKKKGAFHHSSFLSGGATTAAGRLVAHNGVLEAIWPSYSGHLLPTADKVREFIGFLKEHNVDLTNVTVYAVDEVLQMYVVDEDKSYRNECSKAEVTGSSTTKVTLDDSDSGAAIEVPADHHQQLESNGSNSSSNADDVEEQAQVFDMTKRLACKWTSGLGPRIGCVRVYPADLQYLALEKVNLSPGVTLGCRESYTPIPSPRSSPKIRVSTGLVIYILDLPGLDGRKKNESNKKESTGLVDQKKRREDLYNRSFLEAQRKIDGLYY